MSCKIERVQFCIALGLHYLCILEFALKYAMSIRRLEIKNLTKDRQSLVELARRAALSAYAPYSGFKVGAAVLMSDGTVYTGNNQENAAYGQSVCAERVALLYAQAQKPGVAPEAVAIAAIENGCLTTSPVTPCGACRQVFAETEQRYGRPVEILMTGKDVILSADSASDLLPCAFSSDIIK